MIPELDLVQNELQAGEEVEPMADGLSGVIIARLTTALSNHVKPDKLGWVFGSETDFVLGKKPDGSDLKRRPDVAFCLRQTLPNPPRAVVPVLPDIAVEVTSSRDEIDDTDKKLLDYQRVKIKLVWVIRPVREVVEVYREGKAAGLVDIDGELEGSPILPDFRLSVRELFEDLEVAGNL